MKVYNINEIDFIKRYFIHRSKNQNNNNEDIKKENLKLNLPQIQLPEYKLNVKYHSILNINDLKSIGMSDSEYNDLLLLISLFDDYNNKMKWSKLRSVY